MIEMLRRKRMRLPMQFKRNSVPQVSESKRLSSPSQTDREYFTGSTMKELHSRGPMSARIWPKIVILRGFSSTKKSLLRGISVAMYIVGQERRLVDPPSQVVAGVRTVTTKMDGRCDPHVAAPIRFFQSGSPVRSYIP